MALLDSTGGVQVSSLKDLDGCLAVMDSSVKEDPYKIMQLLSLSRTPSVVAAGMYHVDIYSVAAPFAV